MENLNRDPTELLAEVLHTYFCKMEHGDWPNECSFYQEESMNDKWRKNDHKQWIQIAKRVTEKLNVHPLTIVDKIEEYFNAVEMINSRFWEVFEALSAGFKPKEENNEN